MIWNPDVETMPRPQLRALQLERLRWSVQWAYDRVPFHKRRLDAARVSPSDVRSLDDLRRLPFMVKADLREHYPTGLFAVPHAEIVRIHASSGTKGKPTIVGYTREDIETWAEVCARSLACGGADASSIVHIAYGYGLFTGGLGIHYGAERLGALTVPASGGNTPRQLTLMQDLRATVLCCTPSYALNIAETMRERGIDRSSLALELGVFGAEPWTVGMREEIERALGLRALDIYGLSEVMGPGVSMESADDRDGLFIWEDHFFPEVIDPESGDVLPLGEEGELVFTSLTKRAFPVLRYRTGDLCALFDEPSRSGRTMVRMTKVKGRTDDMLIVRGVNVFPSEIERVVLDQRELAPHYQILLSREGALDRLAVHVEIEAASWASLGSTADSDGARNLAERLRNDLAATLALTADVVLGAPGTVPRSDGKAVRVVDRRPS
jgi:phenylacetate-CoA ligase